MLIDPYVTQKLREVEADLARRAPPRPASKPVLGSMARAAGRALRRMGEGLESWALSALPESDAALSLAAERERSERGC